MRIVKGKKTTISFCALAVLALFVAYAFGTPKAYAASQIGMTVYSPGLDKGLVAHWTFDGKDIISNVVDRSGQGNTAILNTTVLATTTVPGPIGQAFHFDGTDDLIYANHAAELTTPTFTISFFVKFDSVGAYQNIISKDRANVDATASYNANYDMRLEPDGRMLLDFENSSGTGYDLFSVTTMTPGRWYHITATFNDATNEGHIYVNGVLDNSETTTVVPNTSSSQPVRIGQQFSHTAGARFTLDGALDDLRIYNRALTAEEIKRLYGLGATTHIGTTPLNLASTPNSLGYGLVGHWTFDGKNMISNVADSSGQGNTGRLSGFTSTTSVPGVIGQGLSFDSTDDFVNIGTANLLTAGQPFTISWWEKILSNTHQFPARFTSEIAGHADDFLVLRSTHTSYNNIVFGKVNASGRARSTAAPSVASSVGVWRHWVITGTAPEATQAVDFAVYADGVSYAITSASPFANINPDTRIGYDGSDNGANAILDDFRVYNRRLSAEEVKRLYGLGATTHINTTPKSGGQGLDSGLVGHWTFDGKNMISNVADSSGRGNTGRLIGFTATTTAFGAIGQALSFNGSSEAVRVSTSADFNVSNTVTYAAWVKRTVAQDGFVLNKWTNGAEDKQLRVTATGNVHFELYTGSVVSLTSVSTIPLNTWTHIAGVYNGTSFLIYINGTLDTSASKSGTVRNNTGPLFLGGNLERDPVGDRKPFAGVLDDVRIYNRVLTAEEMKRLYDMGR